MTSPPESLGSPPADFPSSVILGGASGLIGSALVESLRADGVRVVRLVRRPAQGTDEVQWHPGSPLDPAAIDGIDAAVVLSGAGIGDRRWTRSYKKTLVDSRIGAVATMSEAIAAAAAGPSVLLTASGVGYYGNRADTPLDESASRGSGFLADLCEKWEAAADPARSHARVVHLRSGVVLARHGGLLPKLRLLFRLGLGGRLGSGRQYFSWISLRDELSAIRFALQTDAVRGPVNLVAPQDCTNREFTAALARALHRPAVLPVPRFALRIALGDFADEGALVSQRARPAALRDAGFKFADPTLDDALAAALQTQSAR